MVKKLSMMILAAIIFGCAQTKPSAPNLKSEDPEDIRNRTWQWEITVTPAETIRVPTPERYTILLTDDGTLQAVFDCNKGRGKYQISEGTLSFSPLISTRMACPEGTLDAVFMRDLQRVTSFFMENGLLFLVLPQGSGTMTFSPAAAGPPEGRPENQKDSSPLTATYTIEGRPYIITNGRSKSKAGPESGTSPRVFAGPVYGDMNGDHQPDAALILVHDPGGSGMFYYAAASIYARNQYHGTNGVFIGDRISPVSIRIENAVVEVRYLDRRPEDPMSTPPSLQKSKTLIYNDNRLKPLP